ncbi:MAG: hypothetical protein KGL39_12700 [Patescibacteria group bacterium]|nr:hypothetical protein [Patescibacteria group bacterium]
MLQEFNRENAVDDNGNPAGGYVEGVGLHISWQDGPLGRGEDRKEPNGAFVETVIAAAKQRIEFYQTASNGKFACEENANAIQALTDALFTLKQRTANREARQVEGTHAQ